MPKQKNSKNNFEERFHKDYMSSSDMKDLIVNYEGIKEANKKYAKHTLDSIEGEAAEFAGKVVNGNNIIFSKMKTTERNMVVGFVGVISEISQYMMQPETALVKASSMIEKHAMKNDVLIVGALRNSFLLTRNFGFDKTSNVINWLTLSLLETSSEILKKMEEKWPHPKDEDIHKEGFDMKDWPQPSVKEILLFVYNSEELKNLNKKIINTMHGYINSMYDELIKNLDISTSCLDIFNGFKDEETGEIKEEEIKNRIELVRNLEHQYIDWLFDEKIFEAMVGVMKSSFNLFDLLDVAGISIKNFLSFKKAEEELPEAAEETESK